MDTTTHYHTKVLRAVVRLMLTLTAVLLAIPAAAAPLQQTPARPSASVGAWPAPPFEAYVRQSFGFVRDKPSVGSRLLAMLRTGDQVTVAGCTPACDAPRGWALLEPRGAIPLANLRTGERPAVVQSQSASAVYFYGNVPRPRTPVYAQPDVKSKVLRRERASFRLAFVPDAALSERGWLRRPDGGYMQKSAIKLFTPSTFVGEHDPAAPVLAFVRRKVALRPEGAKSPPKDPAAVHWFSRYDRLPVKAIQGQKVHVTGGWVPRSLVRIATAQERPKGVKPADRWLHVDLAEQILTAYEGDKMVFATLISTGKPGTSTKAGRFEVYGKTVHGTMHGRPWDYYYAEEVPHVLHFDAGRAFHGAYWHDQFGIMKSHGCINLSPADAAWLYQFVPPATPAGWHNVLPLAWGVRPVAVLVDKPGKRQTHPQSLAKGPTPQIAKQ
ncbi:MAG: L,D-transpeptidase [Deltaproteobacteria bacterium]|nr:L,D-transpeptidase [Deltaproteobacteria bacterium]